VIRDHCSKWNLIDLLKIPFFPASGENTSQVPGSGRLIMLIQGAGRAALYADGDPTDREEKSIRKGQQRHDGGKVLLIKKGFP
jgi:hypothetical protein